MALKICLVSGSMVVTFDARSRHHGVMAMTGRLQIAKRSIDRLTDEFIAFLIFVHGIGWTNTGRLSSRSLGS